MFNWLIFFFSLIAAFIEYGFGARYYVVPLILVIVTRTIYIIAFILRYAKIDDLKQLGDDTRAKNESSQDHKNKETTRTSATKKELELKRNDFIYFALSNWLIIFFSVFVPYVSAFFSTYSLLMAGGYFIAISDFLKGKAKTAVEILGHSFYFLGPIVVGTVLSITDDISNLISVSLALSIYITYGHKVVKRTKSTFIHRYRHKKLRTLKRGVKIGLLVLVITMPIFLVAGTVQTGTRRKQTFMVEMRDGTELATSIYFVPGYMDNSLPVVLTRTPYGKDLLEENALGVYTKVYGSQKYHVAIQDIRG